MIEQLTTTSPLQPPPTLDVKHLQVRFPTREGLVSAVDGLSLQVTPGEIVGLVGESGCGKSTAAFAFMRLLPKPGQITGGQILLRGKDIVNLPEREMRALRGSEVAMVFQDALTALDPRMPVGKQIMEPLMIHRAMSPAQARAKAIDLLAAVGIPAPAKRVNQYPHEFSGGMRQRVMIALAISCEPCLLLADEPTTGLDVTVQRQILDLITQLRDKTGMAVILITHDVGVVSEVCDRVVVMYAGREVESGPAEEVFERPRHFYTIGLLCSTLRVEQSKDKPLQAIKGMPPDMINLPPGCPFWPRCPQQDEICRQQFPVSQMVGEGHEAACWRADKTWGWETMTEEMMREMTLLK